MNGHVIKNAKVISENGISEGVDIYSKNGIITDPYPDACEYDAQGMYLAPGFIDLHFHGIMNRRVEAPDNLNLKEITRILPKYGVTGFLPTVGPTMSKEEDVKLLREISRVVPDGANILGFLLEGHFLSLTGAFKSLPEEKDNEKKVRMLIDAVKPYEAIFCISPEFPGIDKLLDIMTQNSLPAFVTHTRADHKQAQRAIDRGATHATHFWNVFPYTGDIEGGVRGNGSVEAFYANPHTTVDFILDGEHVEPVAVKMALACKGIDKVSLITDSNVNAGMPPGTYTGLDGSDIVVAYEGGPARLAPGTHFPGGLAGSGLTMDRALANAVKMLGVSLADAVRMVSTNPASVLKLSHKKGYIKTGYDADMVLLSKELTVEACFVGGEIKYDRKMEGKS